MLATEVLFCILIRIAFVFGVHGIVLEDDLRGFLGMVALPLEGARTHSSLPGPRTSYHLHRSYVRLLCGPLWVLCRAKARLVAPFILCRFLLPPCVE